jgi:membrane fusion protein (multidrug efflux system)
MVLLAIFIILVGLAWFLYWLIVGRFYVYTEDSYVNGNQVVLTPQVAAAVKAIYADNTNLVEKGQLVVELDSSNYVIRVEELKQELANQVREVVGLFENVKVQESLVALRAAELKLAELDYEHRKPLVETGAVSKEEFETYSTNKEVAAASLRAAENQLGAARALINELTVETHPRVQEAVWNLRQAYLDLVRCNLFSPVTGYIGKRSVQVGDQVSPGTTLMFIVPLDFVWIDANYKETQLTNVRVGQPATFTADIYGKHVEYHGKVIGFQPGSGNAFALLPPENASGNWIKIIQRVPVRISVDPDEIRKNPLLLGLSTRMNVDVHDQSGQKLTTVPTCEPIYTTPMFERQFEELACYDRLIEEIIHCNYKLTGQ